MRAACHGFLIVAAFAAAVPGAAATLTRAGDGAAVAADQADAALSADSLVAVLAAGESLVLADQRLRATADSRAMINLSSEFLTVAVTRGRMRLGEGPAAAAGEALLLALDGTRVQRLGFNAARLAATLSPGARPLLAEDLEAVLAGQRRSAFWGAWEPLRVNARAPAGAATEALRAAYLSDPAIVRQRRQAAGVAEVGTRSRRVAEAFLAALRDGDEAAVASMIDPLPFFALAGPRAIGDGRRRAAAALIADASLRAGLSSVRIGAAGDGSIALVSDTRSWRLLLVPRDRALFVAALEPA